MSKSNFEKLSDKFNTVYAFYFDCYGEWKVKVDERRVVEEDCRYEGWGDSLNEAIKNLYKNIDNKNN